MANVKLAQLIAAAICLYIAFRFWQHRSSWNNKEWDHVSDDDTGDSEDRATGHIHKEVAMLRANYSTGNTSDLPESFDARSKWPEWASRHLQIRNQGTCGACAAFCVAQALGDRLFISSNGTTDVQLSPMQIVTCSRLCTGNVCDKGCDGNVLGHVWSFAQKNGLILDSCEPYSDRQAIQQTDRCIVSGSNCSGGGGRTYHANDVFYCGRYGSGASNVRYMQAAIMSGGPITVSFTATDDFTHKYSSGIYHTLASSKPIGGHAIRLIGWGVDTETKTKYWIGANQWGRSWGENGFFKIRLGTNECGIEEGPCCGTTAAA
jgi:cathepsin B